MSALTIHTFGNQRKGKRKETNKKKLQQAIENRERQRARSLEEDKSQSP
jgi:predicted P-loop ATPase